MISIDELEAIVGAAHVLTGEDVRMRNVRWGRTSPCLARAIVRPATTPDLSRIMAACASAGQKVIVHGGLTGLTGATAANDTDIVVSLERMTAIEECDPTERTAHVQAGVTIQALQEAADRIGLSFPVDFGARGSATVGGAISTNAGGNRVFRFGAMREQILGVEAVLADGTIVDTMRGLVKDNSGYDLKQLFIGSEGTLGIVTRACVRLRPRLTSSSTALIALASFADVQALLHHLESALCGQLTTFEVMWRSFYDAATAGRGAAPLAGDHPFYVLGEAEGADQDHDERLFCDTLEQAMTDGIVADAVFAKSGAERLRLYAIRDDVDAIFRLGSHIDFDVSLRLTDMQEYVDHVRDAIRGIAVDIACHVFGHIADGNIHFIVSRAAGFSPDEEAAVKEAVYRPLGKLNGSISAEHGVGLEKRDYLSITRRPEEIACMRLLKRAFDPDSILNPGRVLELPR